tara:strand:+ start:451 stop:1686 length:1236 start_codon:yes stop_codon:yes gene_type:complete
MPENWKTYKLGDLVEVNSNSIRKGDLDWMHYIDIKSVGSGYYDRPTKLDFKDAPSRARRLLLEGDTVISSVRPNLKSFFYANNLDENAIASTGFSVLTPKRIEPRFLYYLTTNDNYIEYLVQSCTGSAYPAFGPKVITDSTVTIPPLPEQRAIASILSALDDKIENNLAMNKTLEDMAMALYKHWFVDFGPFQEGKFIDSELGLIPEGWEVKGLLEIVDLLTGGTPKTKIKEYWNGDIKWVSAKDLGNSGNIYTTQTERTITPLGISKSAAKLLPEDSTIIVARGSVGKMGMLSEPMAINQSCFGLYPKQDYSPSIIYLLIRRLVERFQQISYGSVFDTITTSSFSSTNIVCPPKMIVNNMNLSIEPMFKKIKANSIENQTLIKLRDTLLPKLISGEVRLKEFEKEITAAL